MQHREPDACSLDTFTSSRNFCSFVQLLIHNVELRG